MDIEETPVPLPSAAKVALSTHITLQPPLSRRGSGPGIVLLIPKDFQKSDEVHSLDPLPLQKWAEEGYAVVEIQIENGRSLEQDVQQALTALIALPECSNKSKFGIISTLISSCSNNDFFQ